ncbi:winged helix-turn-helix transcriptional regulator [Candidatus Woesearchaeota archaeon]|nr:winged helix-turn-helix transcriptional regulator [Candidatus Woesearchaeota archaeon]
MTNEKFLMVSLEEDKTRDLAQIISNTTARKILDFLSEKNYCESDIAKKMSLPISTVHYNIQALLKNNLIEERDFVWSEKGKKVSIYGLANKLIIIAPKGQKENFFEKIKNIIPVAVIGFLVSGILWLTKLFTSTINNNEFLSKEAIQADVKSMAASELIIEEANLNYAFWFFLGVVFIVVIYLVFNYIKYRSVNR